MAADCVQYIMQRYTSYFTSVLEITAYTSFDTKTLLGSVLIGKSSRKSFQGMCLNYFRILQDAIEGFWVEKMCIR